jgi:hypothetical protein
VGDYATQTDLTTGLSGKLTSVVGGTNVTVDVTDPNNPIINVPDAGLVDSVNGATGNVVLTPASLGAAEAVHNHEIADVTGLSDNLTTINTNIQNVEGFIANHQTEIDALETTVATQGTDIGTLGTTVSTHETDIDTLNLWVTDQDPYVAALRTNGRLGGNPALVTAAEQYSTGWVQTDVDTTGTPYAATWVIRTYRLDVSSPFRTFQYAYLWSTRHEVWRRYRATSGAWMDWVLLSRGLTSFTPVATNGITVGNGTLSGEYYVSDGILSGTIRFTLGSTSSVTGDVRFTPPIAHANTLLSYGVGRAVQGSSAFQLASLVSGGNIFARYTTTSAAGHLLQAQITSSAPIAWASGNTLEISFSYPTY